MVGVHNDTNVVCFTRVWGLSHSDGDGELHMLHVYVTEWVTRA